MKPSIKNLFLLPTLLFGLGSIPVGQVMAQTFTTLHSFTATDPFNLTNSDGAHPYAGLVLSGRTLYGVASEGGGSGGGTIFKVGTDGTGFTNLYSFTHSEDGANPETSLVLSGDILYGAAYNAGHWGAGTVFKINSDGTGFTSLHSFTGSVGAHPRTCLIISNQTLYGTTEGGGSSGYGTVFKGNTDGLGFTNLHNFTYNDGVGPFASVILSGNTLYGTTRGNGDSFNGAVFKVNTDGTGFTNLYSFSATSSSYPYTNSDGAVPLGRLVLFGNTLYGTAASGGSAGAGTIFAVNTDGSGFTNLHSFIYEDGANPSSGLILSGNALYGSAEQGGSSGNGTVFKLNADGTGFIILYRFTEISISSPYANSDGAGPSGLILSGNTLYGTASYGGSSGSGTVFSLSFAPQLTIIPTPTIVVLTWPTNVAGFDYTGFNLQSTTNLSPAVWTPVVPGPVVVNGQYTVTNPISGTQQFYRLSQ